MKYIRETDQDTYIVPSMLHIERNGIKYLIRFNEGEKINCSVIFLNGPETPQGSVEIELKSLIDRAIKKLVREGKGLANK